MSTTKKYDVACKCGSYEKNGETKNRYINVGVILEKEDGGKFMLLNRTFNPAGIPNPDNKDTVLLSFFEPKQNEKPSEDLED